MKKRADGQASFTDLAVQSLGGPKTSALRGQERLDPWQRRWNRLVSRVRAIGEHPFAWMKRLMGLVRCRYRGLRRNAFDFTLTSAAYNLRRAVSLLRAC